MKGILLTIILLTLTSCASMPNTTDELINSTDIKDSKCYSKDYEAVSLIVKEFLEGCHRTQAILVPVDAVIPLIVTVKDTYQVIEEVGDNNRRYSVRSKYGFGMSIDIKSDIDGCNTQVDMYALRSYMRKKFVRIDDAINGKGTDCGTI